MHDTQETQTGEPPRSGQQHESERAFSEEAEAGGALTDVIVLFTLIGASFRDTARLVGLETRLVFKTVVMMVVLAVVLGLGVWFSITLLVASSLYEYTRLGMTLSIAVASLVNVACAGALVLVLRRLARRLSFPQTRLAVRTLRDDASRTIHKQE